jgi:tetratricopeptide (TPR) repeat protein
MVQFAKENCRKFIACLALVLGTRLLYAPALNFDFVNYDDPEYLVQNVHINRGLSPAGFAWSFNAGYAGNWHPLTWMSHMLDCQLYGLSPGGHHATNVLLHAFSAMLLFLILDRMTGAFWRAAVAAALFAWHPLRVESVAWVSERKDVLSAVFWMLAMWAYIRYAEACSPPKTRQEMQGAKRKRFYVLALIFFMLGLMSKPMLVTFPFVLLLLDWWPLGRMRRGPPHPNLNLNPNLNRNAKNLHGPASSLARPLTDRESGPAASRPSVLRLWMEKIPFFLLSLGACILTLVAQRGAIQSLTLVPLSLRLTDAIEAYFKYVEKTIWPSKLAVLYVLHYHPWRWNDIWPWLFMGVVSATAFRLRKSRPYLLVGWLWYLGALVPVINLVQIGSQAMADRYSYIPSIGLFLMICWAVYDLSGAWPFRRVLLGVLGTAAIAACLAVTRIQLSYWKNSGALFAHAIEVTSDNFLAMGREAAYLRDNQQYEKARLQCEEALRIYPGYADGHFILGTVLWSQGNLEAATEELETALRLEPARSDAHYALGCVGLARKMPEQARQHFAAVLAQAPANPEARAGLGNALAMQGRLEEAAAQFVEALRLAPQNLDARYQLALVLAKQRKSQEAISQYEILLRYQPEAPNFLNNLAWILATDPRAALRDGNKAVALAAAACSLTHQEEAVPLETLSAAYAEAGRFDDAEAAAQKAHDLALAQGKPEIAAKTAELLELYRARERYHEE